MPEGPLWEVRIRRDVAAAEASHEAERAARLRSLAALVARETRARRRSLDDDEVTALLAGEVKRFRSLGSDEGDQLAALVVGYLPRDRSFEELISALPDRLAADAVVDAIRLLGADGPDRVEDVTELVRQRLGPDIDERAVHHEAARQLDARSSTQGGSVDAGRLVSWTPLQAAAETKEPPDLYPEHPGLVVEAVDARYVLVDWVERRQVADDAVYEVADLTVVGIDDYRRLTAEVVARDRAARLGRSEPGARLLADLARAEETGDDGRAGVLRGAVAAVFAEVARDEVARWRSGPSGDDVLATITREATRLRVLANEGSGVAPEASEVLAGHLAEAVAADSASAWLSGEEVAAIVAEAIRETDGSPTVEGVMAVVRPRVSRRAFVHDVLLEVERQVRLRHM